MGRQAGRNGFQGLGQQFNKVPSGRGYGGFMDQNYGDWRSGVFAGGAYPVKQGQQIQQGQPGFNQGGGNLRSEFFASDPRAIMQGDPFKMLTSMAQAGSGAPGTARGVMGPSIAWAQGQLGQDAPLGQGRGELIRQQGVGAINSAVRTGSREIDEASTRFGRVSDPGVSAFTKGLLRTRGAEGYGGAVNAGQQMDLQETQMNQEFKRALTQSLTSMGLGIGGLEQADFNARGDLAGRAGQLESFARNSWTEVLGRLLGGSSGTARDSVEESARMDDMRRYIERARGDYELKSMDYNLGQMGY